MLFRVVLLDRNFKQIVKYDLNTLFTVIVTERFWPPIGSSWPIDSCSDWPSIHRNCLPFHNFFAAMISHWFIIIWPSHNHPLYNPYWSLTDYDQQPPITRVFHTLPLWTTLAFRLKPLVDIMFTFTVQPWLLPARLLTSEISRDVCTIFHQASHGLLDKPLVAIIIILAHIDENLLLSPILLTIIFTIILSLY